MNFGESITVISVIFTLFNGILLFFLNRSYKTKDEKEKSVNTSLDTLSKSLNEMTRSVLKMESRVDFFEKEFTDIRSFLRNIDEVKYKADKAIDSAARAHERVDELKSEFLYFRNTLNLQEKTLVKLNVVTEALQERLSDIVGRLE